MEICKPWNYIKEMVQEGGLGNYCSEVILSIRNIQPIPGGYCCFDNEVKRIYIDSSCFRKYDLMKIEDIDLIEKNIPIGILPIVHFREDGNHIVGFFRKRGFLKIDIGDDKKVILKFGRKIESEKSNKGYYTYTYNNIQEALPMINKIIKEMGYV